MLENWNNRIRIPRKATVKQKIGSIFLAFIIRFIMGLLAKLLDSPNINTLFDQIGGRVGIWVFTATLLSAFCISPQIAMLRVFVFLHPFF